MMMTKELLINPTEQKPTIEVTFYHFGMDLHITTNAETCCYPELLFQSRQIMIPPQTKFRCIQETLCLSVRLSVRINVCVNLVPFHAFFMPLCHDW